MSVPSEMMSFYEVCHKASFFILLLLLRVTFFLWVKELLTRKGESDFRFSDEKCVCVFFCSRRRGFFSYFFSSEQKGSRLPQHVTTRQKIEYYYYYYYYSEEEEEVKEDFRRRERTHHRPNNYYIPYAIITTLRENSKWKEKSSG